MDAQRSPRLSLDLLRGFRAAARQLSFTRAAQELFLTQSAISRGVRTLEEQLGTTLFHRVNRALRLTHEGEQLYRAVDEAIEAIDAAAQRIAGSGRTLAVTTTVPLASMWLGPRLARFARDHPEVDMRLTASNDVLDLARERVDVAIRYVAKGASAPVGGEKLCDYDIFPVCAPALARDRQRPLRNAEDLSRHVLLDMQTTSNGRPWHDWQHWFDAMKIRSAKPTGSLRFSHYDQVVQAAIEGSGVAIGKQPHLERQLSDGSLVAPLHHTGVARIGGFFIIRGDAAHSAPVDAFIAWLHDEARRDTAHLL
jgi:LysR family transcriptional regulator, glycine cleavage system transcriptional activator